ncbi:MarR family winged helix-turn-helix transcriptional regulator [Allostreptomyces psammosilenae]|uniref:DNA-binding MarR family transcriptional regulator n=1 Tax=Allostreptomyces psammosilenae TaxID=1892865 RepID=A0A852ZVE1_9ACTN|nr:MarR family transcriptional regulator [Allostreptomyces psammosilenae]NYI06363.1 DNA-binding MarR family transcriptional regulator [Allostreptomyces psammosilenae]
MATDNDLVARWKALLTCFNEVASHLDRALQHAHGLNMNEFETLDCLVEAGSEYCRMQDLGCVMYLSQSALSRTVGRLERDGLVVRELCADDRRTVEIRVTEAGRQRHAEACQTRLTVLAEHLEQQK